MNEELRQIREELERAIRRAEARGDEETIKALCDAVNALLDAKKIH